MTDDAFIEGREALLEAFSLLRDAGLSDDEILAELAGIIRDAGPRS